MGKLFDGFANFTRNQLLKSEILEADRVKAGIDLIGHAIPWGVGLGFFIGGVYGLESFLAIDFSKNAIENLKKNKMLSDAQQDFYQALGDKIVQEADYNKMIDKKLGKISDENSLLATWKSVYDK